MPYNRARMIMANFQASRTLSTFGSVMGVNEQFYSPERVAEQWTQTAQTPRVEAPATPSPQPPEGAAPAGRTGVQQGEVPQTGPAGVGAPSAPAANQFGGPGNTVVLRQSPFQAGVQQDISVRRPLSQARRFGL